ncbi:hypothetical protein SAMD00019534_086500 [Acytostelium subglobosum LB1]|uniref:hypothetical protein n=1 Tax=Acytostelium subglobosum LB1 TaxID=1410327 RepID=UPI0006451ECA|nr:hypothetical protein SAMD00019534_086500 [Acytostelium subglobosum LB1]GAM25475.1 hypothetical protein SAMD00019534_086500 [Acytostelium subglobosum LB1]|eukprot:XP_012751461.1 hypothetical protein SAMD00019534_086500 [Acytostelium subglobosum LB1]
MATAGNPARRLVRTDTRDLSVVHSYHDEEKQGLVEHLNFLLRDDQWLKSRIPINPKSDLIFDSLNDGIILSKMINAIKPGTIGESSKIGQVKVAAKLNLFEMNVNLDICLRAAKAIGCRTINIGPVDFQEGKRHLILAVLWQLVKIDLLNKVSRLASRVKAEILDLGEKERVEELVPDEILVRWVNHHLAAAGSDRRVSTFSSDIKDSVAYIILLNQLAPRSCGLEALEEADLTRRATLFLETADRINCRKFINTDDIVSGNGRLNVAFVAFIFNKFNQAAEEPPVIASEVIKGAEQRIQENTQEIASIDSEIRSYQERHHESKERIEEIRAQIEERRVADKEFEIVVEERIVEQKVEWEGQRDDKIAMIEQLQEQLAQLQQQQSESTQLVEELQREQELYTQLQDQLQLDQGALSADQELIKHELTVLAAARANQEQMHDEAKKELAEEQAVLQTEIDALQKKVDATGLTSVKTELAEVRAQTQQLETSIVHLKTEEKQLTMALGDAREDKQRIASAKKKIQDQLSQAKDSTDRVVRTRVETERVIDKATKQVKDMRYEVDRIKNDRVYVQRQTEVIRVETGEIEEQLEDLHVEKKRLATKRVEITEELLEREVELEEVISEKTERVDTKKKEIREAVDKMKRVFVTEKTELYEERTIVKEQMVQAQTDLLREAYATESVKREAELLEQNNRSYRLDIRMESIETQVLEEKIERLEREKSKTEGAIAEERAANRQLEEATTDLIDQKTELRQHLNKQSEETQRLENDAHHIATEIDVIADELDGNHSVERRLQLGAIDDEADLETKMSELKDEKHRLKTFQQEKEDLQRQEIERIDSQYEREILRLQTLEEMRKKELIDVTDQVETMDIKQQRLEERLERTKRELIGKAERVEVAAREKNRSEEKKKQLENQLSKAMELLDSGKKNKDDADKDYQLTAMRLKKLKDANTAKAKLEAEAKKKSLEEKMQLTKKEMTEKELEAKQLKEEVDRKAKLELARLKAELLKDSDKQLEKIEREFLDKEAEVLKKREAQINRLNTNNEKIHKEMERVAERKEKEREEERLIQEKLKRQKDRKAKRDEKLHKPDVDLVVVDNAAVANSMSVVVELDGANIHPDHHDD